MFRHPKDVADKLFALLEPQIAALGIEAIFSSDQDFLPVTPALCVSAGDLQREGLLNHRCDAYATVYLYVYHSKIQDNQVTEAECNERAAAVADFIDSFPDLEGEALDCMVVSTEPGMSDKARGQGITWYRTTRITYRAHTRYML